MSAVGDFLAKVRKEKNLSLKAVMQRTGISDSALSHIESGKTKTPSPDYLKKLASEYQIRLVELYILAGYLESNDLSDYQLCFVGANILTEKEHNAVQDIISAIIGSPRGGARDGL